MVLSDAGGREVITVAAGVERRVRGGKSVGIVEVNVQDREDPIGEAINDWAFRLLRDWVELCPPVYGRLSPGDSLTWWELNRPRTRPRYVYYEQVEHKILNPDWAMYLTRGHLAALDVDCLRQSGGTIVKEGDGAFLIREGGMKSLEVGLDEWIECLKPILW